MLNLCDVLQECNPAVTQDLPILHLLHLLLWITHPHTPAHPHTHTHAQLHIPQEYANTQQWMSWHFIRLPCSLTAWKHQSVICTLNTMHVLMNIQTALLTECLITYFTGITALTTKQDVPGGKDLTSGECSLGQTITI